MIRRCDDRDFEPIWAIINDGAHAYKGIIPADRWTEPYMSREKLHHEIAEGVGLVLHAASVVPRPAEFTAAADVGDPVDHAAIEQAESRGLKV